MKERDGARSGEEVKRCESCVYLSGLLEEKGAHLRKLVSVCDCVRGFTPSLSIFTSPSFASPPFNIFIKSPEAAEG